jgi:hypothetical protein
MIRYINVIGTLAYKNFVLDIILYFVNLRQILWKLQIAGSGEGRNNTKYSP